MWGAEAKTMEQLEVVKERVEDVYDMGKELGRGAFSIVVKGKHRVTGEEAALKMISAGRFKKNERAQQAILAEIEAMQRVRDNSRNPCLIAMLGVFGDPSKICIALEKLDGGELFDRIVARGHYTEADASKLLHKLALALKDCHSNGILHRDVKPENILYVSRADDSEIKLTDFGLAMLNTGAAVTRQDDNLVGTPGYVAPEVLQYREYGPPCDVWACGVITYILLVGYPPFFPTEDDTLFDVIKKGQYSFHPDAWGMVSSEAKDLVYKMLIVDTTRRATMESILNHPWVAQQHTARDAHLSGTITRLKAFNAKRKWRAVARVVMLGAKFGLSRKRRRSESEEKRDIQQHGFSDSELQSLREAFDASAVGGVLSRAQLAAVLSDIGFGPVPSDRLFDLFDADGNGKVDYNEFLVGISAFRSSGDKALRFCFDVYDRDGVGTINLEQLKAVLLCIMGMGTPDSGESYVGSIPTQDSTDAFRRTEEVPTPPASQSSPSRLSSSASALGPSSPQPPATTPTPTPSAQSEDRPEAGPGTVSGVETISPALEELAAPAAQDFTPSTSERVSLSLVGTTGEQGVPRTLKGVSHPTSKAVPSTSERVPSSPPTELGAPTVQSRLQAGTSAKSSIWEAKLSAMFAMLDTDGNGMIDFEEFKAGVKREPLLVEAFLAPVQQGLLSSTPAARQMGVKQGQLQQPVPGRSSCSSEQDWR